MEDRSIRMSDFNYLNDPLEFVFSKKYINDISISEELKQNLFCISMNVYDENNKDTFDMWRFYGQNGKGVGIILSIDDNNRFDWKDYYLSSVFYSDEKLDLHTEIIKKHNEFNIKYKDRFHASFNDMQYQFYYLLGFHKSGIYKSENEVRLLKYFKKSDFSINDINEIYHYINFKNKQTTYSKIELACPVNHAKYGIGSTKDYFLKIIPQVNIKEIILGYEFTTDDCYEISECVNNISSKNLGYSIKVRISDLREHFQTTI